MKHPQQRLPRKVNIFLPSSKRLTTPTRRWTDRLLSRMGPGWRYSPARRISQTLCLTLFCWLFFYVAWPYAAVFTETVLQDKELLPVEFFLWLDPLAALTSSVAGRQWTLALFGMAGILLACFLAPRAFCGYVCPLGTLIDVFDWLIGRHITRFRVKRRGAWIALKYYLLTAVLTGAACGVMLSGYVAAIPVLTRGFLFSAGRIQLGLLKGWHQAGPMPWVAYLSLLLLAAIFLLGFLGRRFWCRYVCPTGAVFSLFNLIAFGRRHVEAACTRCGKCITVCPFDAIEPDYTTRPLDCTFCQTCGGACPAGAIDFVVRPDRHGPAAAPRPSVARPPLSRRGFVTAGIVGAGAALAARLGFPARASAATRLLRPPGSVPESEFLDLCIRCGECYKVCPGPVLHPASLEFGLEALWTPVVVPSHAGCHQDCNFCTQVCPTRAIRPLSLVEKRKTPIGLAVIDPKTCLSRSGQRDCQLCFDECRAAGYNAIEMRRIKLELGDIPEGVFSDAELEAMSSIEAPFVNPEACIGCGLCEYRCHTACTKQDKLLTESAIRIVPRPPEPSPDA